MAGSTVALGALAVAATLAFSGGGAGAASIR
ncbi:helicase, partial [Microbacterium lacticum]|nr:helicase [Microbacterium lacticum]